MSVGKKEDIFVDGIHVKRRVVFQNVEIKCNEIFGAAQGTAGMPALRRMYHPDNISSNLCCYGFEILHIVI